MTRRRAATRLPASAALLLLLLLLAALASSSSSAAEGEGATESSKDTVVIGSYSDCEAAALNKMKAALKEHGGPGAVLSAEEGRGVSADLRACHGGGAGGGGEKIGAGGGL